MSLPYTNSFKELETLRNSLRNKCFTKNARGEYEKDSWYMYEEVKIYTEKYPKQYAISHLENLNDKILFIANTLFTWHDKHVKHDVPEWIRRKQELKYGNYNEMMYVV